jgi:hypothetical protein
MVFALWPKISAWLSARGLARRIPTLPSLTFIEGAAGTPPDRAPVRTDEGDPPLRSTG